MNLGKKENEDRLIRNINIIWVLMLIVILALIYLNYIPLDMITSGNLAFFELRLAVSAVVYLMIKRFKEAQSHDKTYS